tara:strand:+ start:149 stop:418 length:270 start_codon:yes stop_codon:yes gene_type:complete
MSTSEMKPLFTQSNNNVLTEKKKKKKKQKCSECGKKLGIISYTCKCGKVFCSKHLNPHSHKCTFDYKNEKRIELEKNNPKLGHKFEKIQ